MNISDNNISFILAFGKAFRGSHGFIGGVGRGGKGRTHMDPPCISHTGRMNAEIYISNSDVPLAIISRRPEQPEPHFSLNLSLHFSLIFHPGSSGPDSPRGSPPHTHTHSDVSFFRPCCRENVTPGCSPALRHWPIIRNVHITDIITRHASIPHSTRCKLYMSLKTEHIPHCAQSQNRTTFSFLYYGHLEYSCTIFCPSVDFFPPTVCTGAASLSLYMCTCV